MKKIYQFLSLLCILAVMTCFTMSKGFAQCNPFEVTNDTYFSEDFSGFQGVSALNTQGVMPTCWSKIYTGSTAGYDPKVYNGTNAVTSGDNCIAISAGMQVSITSILTSSFSIDTAGNVNYIVLPKFVNDLNDLQLVFSSKMSSDSIGMLELGYFTDPTDVSTFVPLDTIENTIAATGQTITLADILTTPNVNAYLAFRWSNDVTFDITDIFSNIGGIGGIGGLGNLGDRFSVAACYLDNFSVRFATNCLEPTNVTVENVTDVTAQVRWTVADPEQTQWEIRCNDSIIRNVTTNPYTLTGLHSTTAYTVNVRAVCGDEISYWAAQPASFTTTCGFITVTNDEMYTEDFTGLQGVDSMGNTGIVPDCWDRIYTGSTAGYDPKIYNGANAVTANDNCLAIIAGVDGYSFMGYTIPLYNTGSVNYVILPNITNYLDTLQLVFTSKMSTDTAGTLQIGYTTDATNVNSFTVLTTIPSTTVATGHVLDFGNFQNAHVQNARILLAWKDNSTSAASTCFIDNIMVRIARNCAEPSNITITNISDVSAVVNWVAADASQNQWEIQCNDTIIRNVTTNPYTLTGLTASTSYTVNVRAVCTDETSYWAAQPATFTTACPAITVTDETPYTDGFEGADLGCWYPEVVEGNDNWEQSFSAFHTGNKGISYSSSVFGDLTNMTDITDIIGMFGNMMDMTNFGNGSARITSPILDLTAVTGQVRLSFYRKQTTMMIPQILFVYYRTSPSGQWVMLQQFNPNSDWIGESINLPNPSATYQISFVSYCDINSMGEIDPTAFMSQTASTDFASTIYIDDIRVGYAIECADPTNISFSNVTETSATATWSGTADSWTLEYGPAGFTQGSGTVVNAQNPTYTFTNLEPGTNYDVYVRANCPESNFSNWVRGNFTTGGTGIAESSNVRLTISPNPTNGVVRCTLNNTLSNARLQVLDVYGKLLMETTVSGQTTELDFSDKASGVYFLRVIDGNSIVTTQKVIRR